MLVVGATVTATARMEIVQDTGTRLTISIPDGLLPVHLTVDPPGAARLLTRYADKATPPA